jgi:sporulation protein YlmC with PRC-barrel domain
MIVTKEDEMAEYGRYGEIDYSNRERERGQERERDRDQERARGRTSMFGGRGSSDRGYREETRRGYGEEARRGGSRSSAWDRDSRYGRGWDRDERYYGYDDYHQGLPIDETSQLIASNKVEGTPVYGREGERLGTVYNFMVDKITGQVEYAVMSYGGFLGLGQRYFPLPWRMLDYDTREGGYHIDMTDRDLERAPSFTRESEPRFSREYGRRVHDYYGLDY